MPDSRVEWRTINVLNILVRTLDRGGARWDPRPVHETATTAASCRVLFVSDGGCVLGSRGMLVGDYHAALHDCRGSFGTKGARDTIARLSRRGRCLMIILSLARICYATKLCCFRLKPIMVTHNSTGGMPRAHPRRFVKYRREKNNDVVDDAPAMPPTML